MTGWRDRMASAWAGTSAIEWGGSVLKRSQSALSARPSASWAMTGTSRAPLQRNIAQPSAPTACTVRRAMSLRSGVSSSVDVHARAMSRSAAVCRARRRSSSTLRALPTARAACWARPTIVASWRAVNGRGVRLNAQRNAMISPVASRMGAPMIETIPSARAHASMAGERVNRGSVR